MRFTVLGSAAAEACPSLWCRCDNCRKAWQNGGKDIRRRTSYLIDDDTWIDFGPDAFSQITTFLKGWPPLKQIFYTHCHTDHVDPMGLYWRHKGFARDVEPLDVYAVQEVYDFMRRIIVANDNPEGYDGLALACHLVSPGMTAAAHDLTFRVIPADHGAPNSVNYFFERQGKGILIANDTGFWQEESWQAAAGIRADLAVIDGTCSLKVPGNRTGHMGASVVVEFRDELLKRGIIAPQSTMIVNHFSHNGISLHAELEKFFLPRGIQVGYDGLAVDV